jgi:hypothetical protein
MPILMKPMGLYLSGWLGQSGLAWELILDPEKVAHLWIWTKETAANCPDAIDIAAGRFETEIPEGEEPGENITINLQKYFLGDIVYSLMEGLPGPFDAHLPAIRTGLTGLRAGVHGLMHDGVVTRLQMRHDLKRHCEEGGACFWDRVQYRWVCIE